MKAPAPRRTPTRSRAKSCARPASTISPTPRLASKEASYELHLVTLTDTRGSELHKQWIDRARKANKPHLERVRLEAIVPAAIVDAKNDAVTDEEGNPAYHFRVKCRLLETAGERQQIEQELTGWLKDQLPRILNQNQTPMAAKLKLDVRESPVFTLQDRIV